MQLPYFIGIDIGTTAIKAVAFDANGHALHRTTADCYTHHPQSGYREQDVLFLWQQFMQVLTQLCSFFSHAPHAVGLSAPMHSFAAFDANGDPLTPFIIWSDERAEDVAAQLHKQGLAKSFYEATGTPVHAMSPLCKWLWLQQYQPAIFNSAVHIAGIKEVIWYQLFGEWVTDTPTASATGFFNVHHLTWDKQLLQQFKLPYTSLSAVQPMQFCRRLAPRTSLPSLLHHVPFVLGGSDGVLAAWAGWQSSGLSASLSIGTSAALRRVVPGVQLHAHQQTFCYHMQENMYVTGAPSNNGLILLPWLKKEVLQTKQSYEQLIEAAAQVPQGSEGLLFMPYLQNERAPHWNKKLSALFVNRGPQHTPGHLVRAVLEGMAYNLKWIGETMHSQPGELFFTTGGVVPFPAAMQLIANVLNCTLHASPDGDGVALGAAGVAAQAVGQHLNLQQSLHCYEAQATAAAGYNKGFEEFKKAFHRLHW